MKINFENKFVNKTIDNIFLTLFLIPLLYQYCHPCSFCISNFGADFFLSGTSDVLSYSSDFEENFKWQMESKKPF